MDNATLRLATHLANLERRLAALETAPRAASTAIRGGSLRSRDATGAAVAELGRRNSDGLVGLFVYGNAGADAVIVGQITGSLYGISVLADTGQAMLTVDDAGGMSVPVWPISWLGSPWVGTDGNGRKTTTSATWSDLWRSYGCFGFGDQFGFNFTCSIPVGTTVDMRITATEVGGSNTEVIWSQTGATSTTTQVIDVVTITAAATASGTDSVLGRYFNIAFQAQRTAGAGTPAFAPIEQSRIYP